MKRSFDHATVALIAVAAFLAVRVQSGHAANDSAILAEDRAWVAAAAKPDPAGAAHMLDASFTWTDANGTTIDAKKVLEAMPPKPLGDEKEAKVAAYTYGQLAVVEANSGTMHIVRIWVKRPAGWRLLVYQEVKALSAPPTVTPGAGKVCENPCKTVPYKPRNADEAGVIESYTGLESSAVAHDAQAWDAHTAEEFVAASSNSDKLLDKPTRLAELKDAHMSGVSPTPLISTQMFDFPGAIVMLSLHKPDKGYSLRITRVWVKRNGAWVETLSYQTAIRPPAQ